MEEEGRGSKMPSSVDESTRLDFWNSRVDRVKFSLKVPRGRCEGGGEGVVKYRLDFWNNSSSYVVKKSWNSVIVWKYNITFQTKKIYIVLTFLASLPSVTNLTLTKVSTGCKSIQAGCIVKAWIAGARVLKRRDQYKAVQVEFYWRVLLVLLVLLIDHFTVVC